MKLTKQEVDFLQRNEIVMTQIIEKRIYDLKEIMVDAPQEELDGVRGSIKEDKFWQGLIKNSNKDHEAESFTGI